ncbi:MAG: hypothetical protein OXQ29_16285 [Rhodospirillaceae bacterium]|nr:hypothetical protein [Rhodospirillaceae bacterium]
MILSVEFPARVRMTVPGIGWNSLSVCLREGGFPCFVELEIDENCHEYKDLHAGSSRCGLAPAN